MDKDMGCAYYFGSARITRFSFNYIEVNPDTQLILSTIVTFGGIAIYLYVNHKMSNQQTN